MQRITTYQATILASLLLVVALFFRVYRIGDIPFGLNNDAAWEGSAAIEMAQGNWQPYVPYATEGWRGEGAVRIIVAGLTMLTGDNPLNIRLASSILGIALLIPLYFFTKELFDIRLGFLTTFFVATSGWHIIMARSGWRAIAVPLVATIALLCLLYAVKKRSCVWWSLAGIITGLSLYTYDAGRIIPLFIGVVALLLASKHRSSFSLWAIVIFIATFLLTSTPILSYAKNNWTNFSGRSAYLFVGHAIQETKSLKPLADNILTTVGLFTHRANGNDFFIDEPLLDWPANYLFLFGLLIVAYQIIIKRNIAHGLILIWLASALVPAIVSTPNGNRAIGAIPAVYIIVAIAADTIIRRLARNHRTSNHSIALLLWIILLGSTCLVTYTKYFGFNRRQPQGFYPDTFVAAHVVKPLLSEYDLYFFDNFPHEILTYLLYQSGDPFQKNYTWYYDQKEKIATIAPTQNKGAAIILFPTEENRNIAQTIQEKYPDTTIKIVPLVTDIFSQDAALVILIPSSE